MQLNVTHNAKRNIIFGIVNKVIVIICPFITRTAIQYVLGAEFLGLNSLFNSILQVLSLSELGFSSAIVYFMYKPVSEGNVKKVNAILNLYKKVYRIIGCVVLGLGLLLIPILPRLITGTIPKNIGLIKLYLVFLLNSVISYFMFAYMSSLVVVLQRDDINSFCNAVVRLILMACQIVALMVTKDYFFHLLFMPVFTVINNLWIALVIHRQYPEFRCEGILCKQEIDEIKKMVAGTFIQKTCYITRNSLDSICISAFLGLSLTAVYNNYFFIMDAVTGLLLVVSNAFAGGIGNHVAVKSVEENFKELRQLDFVYLTASGWCATCLLCLYQPFMSIWMGKDLLLPMNAVVLFCWYFYQLKLGDMKSLYSNANGLWWKTKWIAISETVLNLVLNILLGKALGVYGILLATIISMFICNYIWGPHISFVLYFGKERLKEFYKYQIRFTCINLTIAVITCVACNAIMIKGFVGLAIRLGLCCIIPAFLYLVFYSKNSLYLTAKEVLSKDR